MNLPKGKLTTRTVELSGGSVEVHSMTIAQSRIVAKLKDEEMIAAAINFATGVSKEDALEWLESAPAGDAKKILDAISDVSGLSGAAQFPK
jgi:uncharacterized radical SAM superfamily protein